MTLSAWAGTARAEATGVRGGEPERTAVPVDLTRLHVARVVYDSIGGMGEAYYHFEGRLWERWETDYPQAEQNLGKRLNELTRIEAALQPVRRRLTDADLGDFPLLFMSDVGYMRFTTQETDALREYLRNGGFLWADDFWGDAEWASFERFMRQVLPRTRWREVQPSHPLFRMVFEIERMPQIPARSFVDSYSVETAESPWAHRPPAGSLRNASMRGYFDDDGRLMAIATHNTDIADGWEREAYGHWYFERFSTQSYRLGVNVITYVMTH
ncbi:MAG: DUF4159 domain-containing protein [Pseudomonadales bacterium]